MKEAIGGSWLYVIAITLIALFTTFVSVTTNYNRTYKIKDQIISIIESNDGVSKKALQEINEYLSGIGYSSTDKCPDDYETGEKWIPFTTNDSDGPAGYGTNVNYCIYKHVVVCSNMSAVSKGQPVKVTRKGQGYNTFPRAYYGVVTFFRLDWPILRFVIRLNLTGETSPIFMVNYANENKDHPEVNEIKIFKDMNNCS